MYKREHYDQVLNEVIRQFKLKEKEIPGWQWVAWRAQIKGLFDRNILIREIIHAIAEAGDKRKWPLDKGFWGRVEDVVLKNRREKGENREITVDKPMVKLSDLL